MYTLLVNLQMSIKLFNWLQIVDVWIFSAKIVENQSGFSPTKSNWYSNNFNWTYQNVLMGYGDRTADVNNWLQCTLIECKIINNGEALETHMKADSIHWWMCTITIHVSIWTIEAVPSVPLLDINGPCKHVAYGKPSSVYGSSLMFYKAPVPLL